MTDVHNYENFGGFKSLSKGTTAAAAEVKYDSWSVNGDDPSGPGSPELNADSTQKRDSAGHSTGNTIKKANSKTQRWGDQETYQVGNKYDELEGDAVTVVAGNTSTKRFGWTNNVTHGLTFSTQLGGTVTTSLSFGLTVQIGLKCSIFAGMEASINASAVVKVTKGGYYSFGKADEWGLSEEKNEALLKRTEIVENVKSLFGEYNSIVGSNDMIVAADNELTCTKSSVNAVDYKVSAVDANIFGMESLKISSLGATSVQGGTLSLRSYSAATLNGKLIKIG